MLLRFVAKRLLAALPTLVGLLLLAFILIKLSPTDPAVTLAGDGATAEQIEAVRKDLGVNRPLYLQLFSFLDHVAQGDFGTSLYSKRPVMEDILLRLPATLELTCVALILAGIGGIAVGVASAVWPDSPLDVFVRLGTIVGLALAPFWLAIMLQLVFSMELGWLPLRGRLSPGLIAPNNITGLFLIDSLLARRFDVFLDALLHIILPAVTLAVGGLATIARFTRAAMIEVLKEEYVTYAVAAGVPIRATIFPFALRNALIAPVTQLGLLFGSFISGAVAIEAIYDWPGLGSYLIQSILTGDSNVTLALTFVVGVIYSLANIITDAAQCLIDPRLLQRK